MKGWYVKTERPEEQYHGNAKQYYSEQAKNYSTSGAIKRIQEQLTLRAAELLFAPLESKILDAGCGNGFSMQTLKELGYTNVQGFDIAPEMVAQATDNNLDVKEGDFTKIPYPAQSFDCIVSISALQWLLAAEDTEEKIEKTSREFSRVLKTEGRAVIQFYPKSEDEAYRTANAFREEFKVTLITDNPENSKKRRLFIILNKRE